MASHASRKISTRCKYEKIRHVHRSGIARPIFGGVPKCLTLGEQQYFGLGRRFLKHKVIRYAKNFGGNGPLATLIVYRPTPATYGESGFAGNDFKTCNSCHLANAVSR